ncbi:DUF1127 domain-containing protein [Thalassovita aquimarina]|uniref:DUF1127 domain-containing protein n=1 Tax=Thalassovita aquimarina TaxID=2785917 RepID=A0ABS5HVW6_9RHOB|nr:DUF1127 domain-containing protein [Thalassovita aquimarina]MBR9652663.1 DUF1127 domain-containing protein [Thalassovita aquimarina]
MAVYDNNTQYQAGVIASLISRSALVVANTFLSLRDAIVNWNTTRVTRNELSRLSARELEDIGLCRADIAKVARMR